MKNHLYYNRKEGAIFINHNNNSIDKELVKVAKIVNEFGMVIIENNNEIKVKGVQTFLFSWI